MADSQRRPVGLVGLGNMGLPMASRLMTAGWEVLGVDTSGQARESARKIGVTLADSVADLAKTAGVIILMLPTSDVVDAVSEYILAAKGRTCEIVIDMSSSEPGRTRLLAERFADAGIALVDAPVSGGVIGATSGALTIMAGGSHDDVRRVFPLLEALGSRVVHVGGVGTGHALKALNNLLSATHLLASNEAAIVAARFGIDPETLLSVVNDSSGRSGSTELKLPHYVLTGAFDSGFSARLLEKDVRVAANLATEVGVEPGIAAAVLAHWSELNSELPPDADHTEIIRPLERRYGLEIRSRDRTETTGR
ncbi:MAG TPA: NAD(P)-dependent oxidoreductase [Pseudolysinimonas sp.]|nr:NAD(P)-dependent oxidoreductase [Pseudolysinimonas sp.]